MKRSVLHTALAAIAMLSACMALGLTALFWSPTRQGQTHLDTAVA
jgi:hypothetical protein